LDLLGFVFFGDGFGSRFVKGFLEGFSVAHIFILVSIAIFIAPVIIFVFVIFVFKVFVPMVFVPMVFVFIHVVNMLHMWVRSSLHPINMSLEDIELLLARLSRCNSLHQGLQLQVCCCYPSELARNEISHGSLCNSTGSHRRQPPPYQYKPGRTRAAPAATISIRAFSSGSVVAIAASWRETRSGTDAFVAALEAIVLIMVNWEMRRSKMSK
jgi:hypothetical protein